MVITFGKYKGMSWDDVAHRDPAYLDWVFRNMTNEWARKNAGEALDRLAYRLLEAYMRWCREESVLD